MRRVIAASAVALALVTGVAGCGSSSPTPVAEASPEVVASEEVASAEETMPADVADTSAETDGASEVNLEGIWPAELPLPEGLVAVAVEEQGNGRTTVTFTGADREFRTIADYRDLVEGAGFTRGLTIGQSEVDIAKLGFDFVATNLTSDLWDVTIDQTVNTADSAQDSFTVILVPLADAGS